MNSNPRTDSLMTRTEQIGNLALSQPVNYDGPASNVWAIHTIALLQELQTTLEIDALIPLFSQAVRPLIDHGGILYRHPHEALEYLQGICSGHACVSRLAINRVELGSVTFFRGRPFYNEECERLQRLSALLAHPVRNALLYRSALKSALTDPLTGAANRGAFDLDIVREIELAHRKELPLSLVVIDIDHFKQINDRYGHRAGDDALRSVVTTANHAIRGTDTLYRYGGEEFVVLLRDTNLPGAVPLAERVRKEIDRREHESGSCSLSITISAGIAEWQRPECAKQLFARADNALYRAKENGRNRIEIASTASAACLT